MVIFNNHHKERKNLMIKTNLESFKQMGDSFDLEPFSSFIQLIIKEVLAEHKKDKYRKGTILTPCIMVWLVFAITLRRDLNCHKALNWLISGFRMKFLDFPAKIVSDGTISHARVKLGVDVFRDIFYKFRIPDLEENNQAPIRYHATLQKSSEASSYYQEK